MAVGKTDHETFAAFEEAAWARMAPHYQDFAGRITRQAVTPLLDRANVRSGEALIDIATGPGYVASAALQRGARVLAIDFSPEMVAHARSNFPGLRVDAANAESLPYEYGSFDIATCAFGMLHFPHPGRAVAEAWRVLRAHGRFVFTVWCDPSKSKFFAIINEIVRRFADPSVVNLPTGPGAYMLSDPLVSTALMEAAGFADVRIDEVPCHFTVRQKTEIVEFLKKCAPRALPVYEAQPAHVRTLIDRALEEEGAKALVVNAGRIVCPALLVSGTKRKAPCP